MSVPQFNFALRRYDKLHTLPLVMVSYTESITSVSFSVDGVEACTLFVRDEFTRDRALKYGWKDETESVRQEIEKRKSKNITSEDKKDDKMEFNSPAKRRSRKK